MSGMIAGTDRFVIVRQLIRRQEHKHWLENRADVSFGVLGAGVYVSPVVPLDDALVRQPRQFAEEDLCLAVPLPGSRPQGRRGCGILGAELTAFSHERFGNSFEHCSNINRSTLVVGASCRLLYYCSCSL